MKVLFVGSNPSVKNVDPEVAFKGARSYDNLVRWISTLNVEDYILVNVLDEVTTNNRPLTRSEIKRAVKSLSAKLATLKFDKVVALGASASVALKLLKVTHYRLPHPSSRNRQLNSKVFVDKQLEECKVFLYERKV